MASRSRRRDARRARHIAATGHEQQLVTNRPGRGAPIGHGFDGTSDHTTYDAAADTPDEPSDDAPKHHHPASTTTDDHLGASSTTTDDHLGASSATTDDHLGASSTTTDDHFGASSATTTI